MKIHISPEDARDLMGEPEDGDDAASDLGNEVLQAVRDRDPAALVQAIMAIVDLAMQPEPGEDEGRR